jgi:hypothetical protein
MNLLSASGHALWMAFTKLRPIYSGGSASAFSSRPSLKSWYPMRRYRSFFPIPRLAPDALAGRFDEGLSWAERRLTESGKQPDQRLLDFCIEEYLRRKDSLVGYLAISAILGGAESATNFSPWTKAGHLALLSGIAFVVFWMASIVLAHSLRMQSSGRHALCGFRTRSSI